MPLDGVLLRPPLLARLWVGGFMIFWISMVVWTTMIKHHGLSILVGVLFVGVGLVFASRLLLMGVRSTADGRLEVRNAIGTRFLSRQDVEAFRLDTAGLRRFGQQGIRALLTDGTTFGLDVTRRPSFRVARTQRQLAELERWLAGGR